MLDATDVRASKCKTLSKGTIAYLPDPNSLILTFTQEQAQEDDEPVTHRFFLDLEGEQEFEIWEASEVDGYDALDMGEFWLEIDHTSAKPIQGPHGMKGWAFISDKTAGFIGHLRAKMGVRGGYFAVTLDGDVIDLPHDGGTIAFERWKLVHGSKKHPVILASSEELD